MKEHHWIRYLEFSQLFERFFVSAIVSIIAIRFYLELTGFPQIGAGDLHIAHMLWGGLLLTISLLGSLIYLNNDAKHLWAILGGAGFGTFIDEIGKFITHDNNYFYQPTFALIYVIFVCLYLIYRNLLHRRSFTKKEYLVNSIEKLKEVVTNEMDQEELIEVMKYLKQSDQRNKITKFLSKSFRTLSDIPPRSPSLYHSLKMWLTHWCFQLITQRWVVRLLVLFFLLRSAEFIVRGFELIINTFSQNLATLQLLPTLNVFAIFLQAVLTVIGALLMRRSRIKAFRFFRNSLLVSIFVLQLFIFYQNPLLGLLTTLRDVALLTMVEYFINSEKVRKRSKFSIG